MTIDRISSSPLGPIDRSDGGGRNPTEVGQASVRSVALAVVGRIAAELSLAGQPTPLSADPYRLRSLAEAVSAVFPGSSPASIGDLERAIETVAGVIAADMAGAADGGTLERVDRALADFRSDHDGLDGVTEYLNEAAQRIADAV